MYDGNGTVTPCQNGWWYDPDYGYESTIVTDVSEIRVDTVICNAQVNLKGISETCFVAIYIRSPLASGDWELKLMYSALGACSRFKQRQFRSIFV
jgi:hypothetical protein